MALHIRLRELRVASGQSLQQVAEKVGTSKAHLSDLERGVAANPGIELLKKLAEIYAVSVASLIGEAAAPSPPPPVAAQVEGWISQIRKERAAGLDTDTAAREARESFERLMGPLDPQQEANWAAARDQLAAAFEKEIEFLASHSLRKPRRAHWYDGPKAADRHWPALESFLLTRKGWDSDTVASIDRTSTEVVSLMENPKQTSFRGRGMVVGYVQSGKTANMEAVIAKAVDAGYRFVIILTGMTNSLRAQTQDRLEADLLQRHRYEWFQHTTSEVDFRTPASKWFAAMDPVQFAAVKKNVSPLKALLSTIRKTSPTLRGRMPVLIIDDECDQAGVNASGSQFNMTAINGLIRQILAELPKVQYVGYTATPFANVLINPETPAGSLDDLYPEDFITALPLPRGYFGPESLFGRDPINAEEETIEESGLDMVREVPDDDVPSVQPTRQDRALFAPSIPPSLDEALSYFVLATACRYFRGHETKHSSMLVHTTVYTGPHHAIADAVRVWQVGLAKKVEAGDQATMDRLKALWDREKARVSSERFGLISVPFSALTAYLKPALDDIEVVVENSTSSSRLDYGSGPKKYIVVGGSVLARGLTIEGLMVSYFVRTTGQYDTLLQMGRWFGYRPGYQDLPRIWMTSDLSSAFRDLATVEAEIRGDIDTYRKREVTPADFAVRIRQIPGMTVTAAKKMIAAEVCDVSYSGDHIQTIRFPHTRKDVLDDNWTAGATLIDNAVAASLAIEPGKGGRLIRKVPLSLVLDFLSSYSGDQRDLISGNLLSYIEAEAERADAPYAEWNVGIVEPASGSGTSTEEMGAFGHVGLVRRARLKGLTRDGLADIKALMSRQDVLIDVEGEPADMSWDGVKSFRQSQVGDKTPLLLLYAIDPSSTPRASSSGLREPLGAVRDILGLGLILPERGTRKSYVRVRLPIEDGDEQLEEDLAEQGAEEPVA
jgi:transcriptional regulator with XRE-family HTH domain